MNSAIHQFSLRVPIELWEQLEKHSVRRGITEFILEAIQERLNQEQSEFAQAAIDNLRQRPATC